MTYQHTPSENRLLVALSRLPFVYCEGVRRELQRVGWTPVEAMPVQLDDVSHMLEAFGRVLHQIRERLDEAASGQIAAGTAGVAADAAIDLRDAPGPAREVAAAIAAWLRRDVPRLTAKDLERTEIRIALTRCYRDADDRQRVSVLVSTAQTEQPHHGTFLVTPASARGETP